MPWLHTLIQDVSKRILFLFTCSIKMSCSEKILRCRQFMAARSSLLRLRHFYEAEFRRLISYRVWGLWKKKVELWVAAFAVYCHERGVCHRSVCVDFLGCCASGNQQKGSLRWKSCTPATRLARQRPGKTAHVAQWSTLVTLTQRNFA